MSRNVLITGSTSGIGLGIAEAFAKNGDNIVFNGLEENGAEIAKSIGEKYGVKSVFKNSNLMTPEVFKNWWILLIPKWVRLMFW